MGIVHKNGQVVNAKARIESAEERPSPLTVRPGGIPQELRDKPQWVAWQYQQRGGKWTKVPIDPKTGRLAKSNDPSTWGTFKQAEDRCKADGLDGVGFMFTAGDDFVGVDLDDCRDPESGEITEEARGLIERLDSYTEVSPSGTGVKIFARGTLPPGRCRTGKLEMYDRGRFFCVTGRHLDGTPKEVLRRTKTLARVHAELFPAPTPAPAVPVKCVEGEAPEAPARKKHKLRGVGKSSSIDSDDSLIEKAKQAKNGRKFSQLWSGDYSGFPSRSEADLALCGMLAVLCGRDPAKIDRMFRRSGLYREKWEREDYRTATIAKALEGRSEYYKGDDTGGEGDGQDKQGRDSSALQLVKVALSSGCELIHDTNGEAFITLPAEEHRATLKLRSKPARQYLSRCFYQAFGRVIGAQALQDAIGLLEGQAVFEGGEHKVHLRIAEHEGCYYLDLCDAEWRAVRIAPDGWKVITNPPVKFRRAKAMLPLPVPEAGGSVHELFEFLNVHEEDRSLILGWLVAALRPSGPYPLLCLHGEQGSSKSTTSRLLRSVIDPNTAPVRAEPREARDLAIAANNSHTVCLDNLSNINPWLSDALCRLSTGGGFATRTLYSDEDETIFEGQRPIILNGIAEVATRGDLLDRSIMLTLPTIPAKRRRPESELWSSFNKARPRIFGTLLTAVAAGLKYLPTTKLTWLPRMADFALWVTACEPALGVDEDEFREAYTRNVATANVLALGETPLIGPLRQLLQKGKEWAGTASDLLAALTEVADPKVTSSRDWPKRPNHLSNQLRRLAPNLRRSGIQIVIDRDKLARTITISADSFNRQERGRTTSSSSSPSSSIDSGD